MVNLGEERHLVTITFYPPGESSDPTTMTAIAIVVQVRLLDPSSPLSATQLTNFPQQLQSTSSDPSTSSSPNNLFEELDTTRHTSWQYELTHLRIANKNLLDDITKLEIQQGLREPEPEPQSPDLNDGEGPSSRNKKRSRSDTEQSTEISGT